jgi:phosphopantothenoylcysteine decarboxylase/phosphopantothenate--cysteine ligase
MGVAVAAEAARRGADVTLLAANLAVPAPPGVETVPTPTAADLAREALARAESADLVVMAAAVADYRPAEARTDKRPKDTSNWTVELEPTTDVLAALGELPANGRVLVGFAAETGEDGIARAREKLERKRANLLVFNDVSREDVGFDALENEVVLITRNEERRIGKAPKRAVAAAILDEAQRLMREANGRSGE